MDQLDHDEYIALLLLSIVLSALIAFQPATHASRHLQYDFTHRHGPGIAAVHALGRRQSRLARDSRDRRRQAQRGGRGFHVAAKIDALYNVKHEAVVELGYGPIPGLVR